MDLRIADASHLAALEGLLLEAANWSPDRNQLTLVDLQENDVLVRYIEEWPRAHDAGVIAERDDRVVGAAWFRPWGVPVVKVATGSKWPPLFLWLGARDAEGHAVYVKLTDSYQSQGRCPA